MKKILSLILAVLMLATSLLSVVSCTTPADTTKGTENDVGENGVPIYQNGELFIVGGLEGDVKSNYQVVYRTGANTNPTTGAAFKEALTALRKAFKHFDYQLVKITDDSIPRGEEDTFVAPEYEILIGRTNREESNIGGELAFNEAVIRTVGKKIVILGKTDSITTAALYFFIDNYMSEDKTVVTVPTDLNRVIKLDLTESVSSGKSYMVMADEMFDSFHEEYWTGTWLRNAYWWDAAEMLETYIDAYEARKDAESLKRMEDYAKSFIREKNNNWSYNEFNDDIMWACIAFARIAKLTDNNTSKLYAKYAKDNFDRVWARSYDTRLGGGLYWKKDNTTKNSCVNCPASIAACLIGDLYSDDTYYEKAKSLMDWEFKEMFEPENGKVYDAYPLGGEKSTWASTYNQGTFIGACTLLYKKYGDEKYIQYAGKAADYAMNRLTSGGILDNGEGNPSESNRDLIGFKGILTRWLYRYAKEVNSIEILSFLQQNMDKAYSNRNAQGLCWTQWQKKTPDDVTNDPNYFLFGMSTCVALAYNCHQWWE